jgi:hypothetical protein
MVRPSRREAMTTPCGTGSHPKRQQTKSEYPTRLREVTLYIGREQTNSLNQSSISVPNSHVQTSVSQPNGNATRVLDKTADRSESRHSSYVWPRPHLEYTVPLLKLGRSTGVRGHVTGPTHGHSKVRSDSSKTYRLLHKMEKALKRATVCEFIR